MATTASAPRAAPLFVALAAFVNMASVGSVYALSSLQTELPRLLHISQQHSFMVFSVASLGLGIGVRTCGPLLNRKNVHTIVGVGTTLWGFSVALSGYFLHHSNFLAMLTSFLFGGVGIGWTYLGIVVMVGQTFPTQPLARSVIGPLGFSSGTAACVALGYYYSVGHCNAQEIGKSLIAAGTTSVVVGTTTLFILPRDRTNPSSQNVGYKKVVGSHKFLSILLFFNALPGMIAFSALQPLVSAYHLDALASKSLYYIPYSMIFLALGGLMAPSFVSWIGTKSTFVFLFLIRGIMLVLLAKTSLPTIAIVSFSIILFGHGAGFSIIPSLVKAHLGKGTQFPDVYGQVLVAWGAAGIAAAVINGVLIPLPNGHVIIALFTGIIVLAFSSIVYLIPSVCLPRLI